MKTTEFNINNYVRVRLTETGINTLRDNHDALNGFAHGVLGDFAPPKEDKGGWSRWQLWELMHQLGPSCMNGFNVPFETTIQILCEGGKDDEKNDNDN